MNNHTGERFFAALMFAGIAGWIVSLLYIVAVSR